MLPRKHCIGKLWLKSNKDKPLDLDFSGNFWTGQIMAVIWELGFEKLQACFTLSSGCQASGFHCGCRQLVFRAVMLRRERVAEQGELKFCNINCFYQDLVLCVWTIPQILTCLCLLCRVLRKLISIISANVLVVLMEESIFGILSSFCLVPSTSNVFFFWLCCAACGILVPNQGSNPCPLQWKRRVLTTGPPGKSQQVILLLDFSHDFCKSVTPEFRSINVRYERTKYAKVDTMYTIYIHVISTMLF